MRRLVEEEEEKEGEKKKKKKKYDEYNRERRTEGEKSYLTYTFLFIISERILKGKNLPVANEAAERMIEQTTDYLAYEGRRKEDFQGTLHLVGKAIQEAPVRRTKAVLVKAYGQKDKPLFHGAHMFACVSMCDCVGVRV